MMLDDSLEVVTTPTLDWLSKKAKICRSRMVMGSPYVNNGVLKLTSLVPKEASRTLVTRTDLRDFAVRASSLDSLCTLAKDGVNIRSLSKLHAKVYVFDDATLVTSANATFAGMSRNLECGLATNDKEVADRLASSLLKGFGTRRYPPLVTLKELEGLYEAVAAIRVSLPPAVLPSPEDSEYSADSLPTIEADFSIVDDTALIEGLAGWKRLTMRGVLEMPEGGFQMSDLLPVCQPMATREYPNNHRVREKLRQQLQYLRDLGLVEFVDDRGFYRRTMN